MSVDGDERPRRRRRGAVMAASPAGAPPTSSDILWQIFLRLPPLPSSLPRVSLVCKRWRRLTADAEFLLHFRAHHRKAPILGLFNGNCCSRWVSFTPILDPPNRISRECFSFRVDYGGVETYPCHGRLLGCRHGRVLILDPRQSEHLVCDPITGEQRRIALPREFGTGYMTEGAVLCANNDKGHVHGGFHSSPFKVVLVGPFSGGYGARASACVYSSETGEWSSLSSVALKQHQSYISSCPSTLVGGSLYWWHCYNARDMDILEFDIVRQSLSVIRPPNIAFVIYQSQIIHGEDGGVGLAVLSYPRLRILDLKVDFDGESATWGLRKTVFLDLVPNITARETCIVGYIEDDDAILMKFNQSVFLVHLESAQSNKLCESIQTHTYHPFTSFYSSGKFGRCEGLANDPSAAPAIELSKQKALTAHVRKKARRVR